MKEGSRQNLHIFYQNKLHSKDKAHNFQNSTLIDKNHQKQEHTS